MYEITLYNWLRSVASTSYVENGILSQAARILTRILTIMSEAART